MPDCDRSIETSLQNRDKVLDKICLDYLQKRTCSHKEICKELEFWSNGTSQRHVSFLRTANLVVASRGINTVGVMPTVQGLFVSITRNKEVKEAAKQLKSNLSEALYE